MQVDPIKPTLKAGGYKRLKPKYVKLLSSFAFKFNLRRFSAVHCMSPEGRSRYALEQLWAPGQTLNRQGLILVNYSAQHKHILWETLGA